MPKLSLITFAIGARQLVVHEAFENTKSSSVITSSLTPKTTVLASGEGAEQAAGGEQASAEKPADDNVVDAEFEEVKEDEKKEDK